MSRLMSFLRYTALWILLLPIAISYAGCASNQLVLWANNDTFPVKINVVKLLEFTNGHPIILPSGTIMIDDTHCVMTSQTHLNLLADNWDFRNDGIESIGDVLLDLGSWLSSFCPFVWGAFVIFKLRREHAV